MIATAFALARPLLGSLDPETAHQLTLRLLRIGLRSGRAPLTDPRLSTTLWDLHFASPIGIAAGFDKNAQVAGRMGALGVGFAEVGTVTPRPQRGNERPRLFRLKADQAVINRMGFNNDGHQVVAGRMAGRGGGKCILGVNIGANKDSPDRIADYVAGVEAFADRADYLTINISSPNTPGLRDLQAAAALAELLARTVEARDRQVARVGRKVPLLLKVAPDLDPQQIEEIATQVQAHPVDGCIISNTTVEREGLVSPQAAQAGGVSGTPLFHRSTIVLARFRRALGPGMPLIGVGGIDSGEAAWQKIVAGATLLQLYTGLIYQGPRLLQQIHTHLQEKLQDHGLGSISQAVGLSADHWAQLDI